VRGKKKVQQDKKPNKNHNKRWRKKGENQSPYRQKRKTPIFFRLCPEKRGGSGTRGEESTNVGGRGKNPPAPKIPSAKNLSGNGRGRSRWVIKNQLLRQVGAKTKVWSSMEGEGRTKSPFGRTYPGNSKTNNCLHSTHFAHLRVPFVKRAGVAFLQRKGGGKNGGNGACASSLGGAGKRTKPSEDWGEGYHHQ